MDWILPKRLQPGMTLAFTAPASATEENLEALEALVKEHGYKSVFGASCYRHGLYGGTPEEQAAEFNAFMTDDSCDAVIALRGGYGTVRYLDLLDYEGIRKSQKPFVGYSDCTALHTAIGRYSRLVTYHGPMGVDWLKPGREKDIAHLFDLLEGKTTVVEPLPAPPRGFIGANMEEGRLIGGNLAILCSLGGTPYAPNPEDWDDAVLLLEDIGEPPYKIDRMLQQLRRQGVLSRVKGVALGTFTDCEDEDEPDYEIGAHVMDYMMAERDEAAPELFVCYVPTGHGTPHQALPLGSYVSFRAISNTLVLFPYCEAALAETEKLNDMPVDADTAVTVGLVKEVNTADVMNGNTDVVADVTTESVAVLNTYADSLAAREARIHEAVKAMEQSLIDLSAYLHDNPEVGLTEHKAVAAITKVLKNKAFTVKTDVSDGTIPELATSLKADKGNMDSFFKMAFLGEYDALPGLGHGCGHNLIAAMSVGAAIGFAAAVPEALTTFFGCPAEETVGGKVFMANAGVFNGYAGALLTHPADVNELGGSSLASHPLEVKFIGRSAHVADLEDHGINALTCAVELYTAVNALKDQWGDEVVIGQIFTEAGEAPNMIPAEAVLHMTVRAHTVEFLEDIVLPAVRSKAEEIAKAQGAKVAMRHYEPLFKDLREDKTWRDLAQAVMTEWRATPTILPDNVAEGSTDMGNVSHVVPTVQLTLAIGEDMGLHTPEFAARAGSPEGLAMIQKGTHIMAITALRYWWRYGRDFDRAVK